MKAFHSNKPLYLFLCCINATLLLLIFMASGTATPPPSISSGHSHARVHGQYIVPLINMRKMVTTATSLFRDLPPQYRFYPALHHGTDAAVAGAQQLRLSKLIATRRSLLHLSEGPVDHHKLMSTTTMAVPNDAKSHAAASTTTSTNIPHDHEADVSATFHVDYSGPKTHPPKNN